MSSTSASASPSPSATSTSSGGPSGIPSGTIPFSFLITFLAVFLFFLGCGFCSRRLSVELRRTLGLPVPNGLIAATPPLLWDVAPCKVRGRMTWLDLMPLSATYVRAAPTSSTSSSQPNPTSRQPQPPTRPPLPLHLRILDYIPLISLLLAVREMRRAQAFPGAVRRDTLALASVPLEAPPPPVRAVQIAVLIAMPSAHRPCTYRNRGEGSLKRLRASASSSGTNDAELALPRLGYAGTSYPEKQASWSSENENEEGGVDKLGEPEAGLGEYAVGIAEVPWLEDEDSGHD